MKSFFKRKKTGQGISHGHSCIVEIKTRIRTNALCVYGCMYVWCVCMACVCIGICVCACVCGDELEASIWTAGRSSIPGEASI